jgi:ATP-binding cassette, subfamily B, bacterial HlyB/CyaB
MSAQLNLRATAAVDSGLGAVLMLLRQYGIGADAGQIRHRFGGVQFGIAETLRCATEFGLRALSFATDWARVATTSLPDADLALNHRTVRLRTIELLKQRNQSAHGLPSITVLGRGQAFRRTPAGKAAQG